MAADLGQDPNITVQMVKGGLGELSVDVEGKRIFSGNRLWYPTTTNVIKKVRAALE